MFAVQVAAILLAGAPAAPDDVPPIPELDKTPVTGVSPVEAATRALGAAGTQFIDRRQFRMHPMVPGNLAGASFYLRPTAVAPGLCGVRLLYIEMEYLGVDPRRRPTGFEPIRVKAARWWQRFKAVRVEDLRAPTSGDDLGPTRTSCEAMQPSTAFIFDWSGREGFDAPSAESAWRHAVLLKSIVRPAPRRGRLGFHLVCDDFSTCGDVRHVLGRLSPARLVSVGNCTHPTGQADCYAMFVEAEPRDRDRYVDAQWRVEVVTRPGRLDRPTQVLVEFHVPPVI